MGPLMVLLLLLLASSQLSHAAVHLRSSEQATETDRIAVQAALQDLMHTDSSHTGRGVTVSTKGVVLREAAAKRSSDPGDAPVPLLEKATRTNDPGDSPVRITSKSIQESSARTNDPGDAPVRQSSNAIRESAARTNDPGDSPVRLTSGAVSEAGQARYIPSKSNDANAADTEDINPDAVAPHYVSAPTGTPIYVRKVTYDQPHAAIDAASAAGAAATTVRNLQRDNDPAGRPWGEYNEWLSVTVSNGGGQYGDANAAGGYGMSGAAPGYGQATVQSFTESQDPSSSSTAAVSGLDTVGADTVGADPVGADTQGADTVGSGAAAAAAQRKLQQTTVSVAGVNVDVSSLSGKTTVDVAAPYTGVAVHEAGPKPAADPAESAYDELTALLATDDLSAGAATPGQYGQPGAAGGYGYGRYREFSIQSHKEPSVAISSTVSGLDTVGTDTKGSDTVGADTKGSDTAGADTKGSNTQGSAATDTKGADTRGLDTAGADTKGSDTKGSDTVGADTRGAGAAAAAERKLLQTVSVDMSNLSGRTDVDVAAPFASVSARKQTGAATATAAAVRALLEAAAPAESAYDELTALLATDDLSAGAATPGQYGQAGAAGGYGYGEFSIQSYKEPAAVSSTGLDAVGADTKGADTKGSDTAGADTKGSDTVGADTVGSGAAAKASSSISESGQAASGTVGGVYEDPGDFSTQRKLLQTTTVSVAGVNVDVSRLSSGKTAVDVAAPFTGVSVRKEAAPAAPARGSGSGIRKLLRRLLDSAQKVTAADSAKDDAEAEQVEAEHVGDVIDGHSTDKSQSPQAKTSSSSKKSSSHSSSKQSSYKGAKKGDDDYSSPPAGGYYSKKSTYKGAKAQSTAAAAAADKAPTAADKASEDKSKGQTPVQASISKVDTKGADTVGADTKGADTVGAGAAKPAAAAAVAVAAVAKPAAVKSFHFATADGEGSDEKPEGASDTPLSMKAAVAAAAAAVDESKPPPAAAAKGGVQVASAAATAAKPEAVTPAAAAAAEAAKKASPSKPAAAGSAVGAVQPTQEPKAAEPMFTKLTLTPKQIEEVKNVHAQMAATGEDEEDSLPLTTGAKSKSVPAIPAAAVKTAAIAPAKDAKPVHLPGTKAVADVEDDDDDDDDEESEDKSASQKSVKADDKTATAPAGDKKATATAGEKTDKATVPAKAPTDLKKWAGAKGAGADVEEAPTAEADLVDEMEPEPENKVVDKDAPRDPFFNVVSKPESPLAGLFGIIRPASVQPRSASPRSPRKAHTRKHGKSGKSHHKGHKELEEHDLNPEMPHNPYKGSPYTHDMPTAAGISSSSSVEGFKVATAAAPANVAVASAAKPQDAKAGQPFLFAAKEAGNRAAAAAGSGAHIPGSSSSSSSQDAPIEVVRGARKLLA